MLFHKIAITNHRNDFECLAILLHLELVYCENAVDDVIRVITQEDSDDTFLTPNETTYRRGNELKLPYRYNRLGERSKSVTLTIFIIEVKSCSISIPFKRSQSIDKHAYLSRTGSSSYNMS